MRRTLTPLFRSAAFGAVALGVVVAGCKSEQKSTSDGSAQGTKAVAFNTVCPVSHHPVEADAPTRQYQGKTVGFCCENCPQTWDKSTVAERDAMLEKVAAK